MESLHCKIFCSKVSFSGFCCGTEALDEAKELPGRNAGCLSTSGPPKASRWNSFKYSWTWSFCWGKGELTPGWMDPSTQRSCDLISVGWISETQPALTPALACLISVTRLWTKHFLQHSYSNSPSHGTPFFQSTDEKGTKTQLVENLKLMWATKQMDSKEKHSEYTTGALFSVGCALATPLSAGNYWAGGFLCSTTTVNS